MGDLRHALFRAGFHAIALTGANRWLRPVAQGRGLILALHRVRPWRGEGFTPNRSLEITPEFLERAIETFESSGFEFLSLEDVPERLARDHADRPFVVFTFDDGYLDNLHYAWPILKRRKVPWTLFVVPDFLDGHGVLWWLDLEAFIGQSQSVEATFGNGDFRLPAGSIKEKYTAFATIAGRLMAATREEIDTFSASVAKRLGRDRGAATRHVCASWEDISELCHDTSVTIGAHSCSHPILSHLDDADAKRELRDSRACLEQRLSRSIRHFAYPHGGPKEAGPREFRLACEAGYVSAVTTRPAHLGPEHAEGLHALPRISMNGFHQTDSALRAIVSGVPFLRARPVWAPQTTRRCSAAAVDPRSSDALRFHGRSP